MTHLDKTAPSHLKYAHSLLVNYTSQSLGKVKNKYSLNDHNCARGKVIPAFAVICGSNIQGGIAPFQTKTIDLSFKWPGFKPSIVIISQMTLSDCHKPFFPSPPEMGTI